MYSPREKAFKLRLQGKSYSEITKLLGIPKSTLSGWFKNLALPRQAKEILKKKGCLAKKQLIKFNKNRSKLIKAENETIRLKSFKEISKISKYELLLVGTTLYWGEGYKSEISNTGEIQLSNSDPKLIALFLRFLREILLIPEDKIKACIHIHPNVNKKRAINFWLRITKIPQKQFRITQQVSKASRRKRPSRLLPFGTLSIRVHSRKDLFRIKGWIDALKNQD